MQSNDLPRFVELLQALASTLGRQCDEAMLTGYELGLQDLSIQQIETAVGRAIRERKRVEGMPAPADLRELAGVASSGDRAQQAWHALLHAISAHGAYRSVDFDDPLINACVRVLGGWPPLCEMPESRVNSFYRTDWLKTYAAFQRAGVRGDACLPLEGLSEGGLLRHRDGRTEELPEPEPVRVITGLPATDATRAAMASRRQLMLRRSSEHTAPRLTLQEVPSDG